LNNQLNDLDLDLRDDREDKDSWITPKYFIYYYHARLSRLR
jgi:hypothetical protein